MSVDLSSQYLGLQLKSPVVASACPLTGNVDMLRRLEAAGAGAAVLPSLFEEQIEYEEMSFGGLMDYGAEISPEAASFFPELDSYNTGPDDYINRLEEARDAVSMPVIASLNGASPGGWTRFAKVLEAAGASALELNTYNLVTDPSLSAAQVEDRYLELVASVRSAIDIPLAVKLGPFFTALPHFAQRLFAAGADGLVLFNRFFQPDLNLEQMVIDPHLELSHSSESRLAMRWIAILDPLVTGSLAANSGIHTAFDVFKLLLVGADATLLASTLLRNGPEHVQTINEELRQLLREREYVSAEQCRGSFNHQNTPDPEAFERHNYMKALTTYITDLP